MRSIVTFTTSLCMVSFLSIASVFANDGVICTTEPQENWKEASLAEQAAKELGYEISTTDNTIITDGGCYKVYGSKDGNKVDLFFNPTNQELVSSIMY